MDNGEAHVTRIRSITIYSAIPRDRVSKIIHGHVSANKVFIFNESSAAYAQHFKQARVRAPRKNWMQGSRPVILVARIN